MHAHANNPAISHVPSERKRPPTEAPLPARFLYRLRKLVTAHKARTGALPTIKQSIHILRGLDAGELYAIAVNAGIGRTWRRAALDRLNRIERERQKPGMRERQKGLRAAFGLNVHRRGEGAP